MYGENETNVDDDLSEMTTIEKVKYQANQEVFMYLIATSICGIVDTAKRNRLNGKSIENQVFIHNNQNYNIHRLNSYKLYGEYEDHL